MAAQMTTYLIRNVLKRKNDFSTKTPFFTHRNNCLSITLVAIIRISTNSFSRCHLRKPLMNGFKINLI